ncbi:hypothetical protein VTK73DRAFT_5986 [Phialemonium thermophilum]|uniref:Uncharacterized protein n=1 Tax=Phialemonium thermophilum TaxID=223376 RepID=A0ABR3V1S6_9PEZI
MPWPRRRAASGASSARRCASRGCRTTSRRWRGCRSCDDEGLSWYFPLCVISRRWSMRWRFGTWACLPCSREDPAGRCWTAAAVGFYCFLLSFSYFLGLEIYNRSSVLSVVSLEEWNAILEPWYPDTPGCVLLWLRLGLCL